MKILRTPEERFSNLPGYPFAPHYVEIDGARMHYVDEGPPEAAETVLMLHGEPSWSYLYRKMIEPVARAGARVVAPDLFGFGKSDKFADKSDYSYAMHVASVARLIDKLELRNITLVCQDWGGLIGLRVAAENEALFARILAANTGLPTGDEPMPKAFKLWLAFSQATPFLPIGRIIKMGCRTKLDDAVVAAYEAPFPDHASKAGARVFPALVPVRPDDPASAANRRAWEVLRNWEKPFLTAFSDGDPITRGAERKLQALVPGARGLTHPIIRGAGHFLQEDAGEELARVTIEFVFGKV